MFQRKIADVWLYSLARKIFGSSQGTFLHRVIPLFTSAELMGREM